MSLEKMDEFFNKRADTYDEHMLVNLQLGEFYQAIASCFPSAPPSFQLLDLGCGTGIELELLFERYPNMHVTGVDLSEEMLKIMKSKFSGKKVDVICGSYFEVDYGEEKFDYVLSTYSLHHFSEETKTALYQKIYTSLKDGGIYIEGDYTVKTMEQQLFHLAENERLRTEQGVIGGFYHYDTPFTVETQIKLLQAAGFQGVKVAKEWESTTIFIARKQSISNR